MQEIGEGIMQRSKYAQLQLSKIEGVKAPFFKSTHFKEFIMNFDDKGITVEEINKALLKHNIFGGKSLKNEFPELGNSALFCFTEVHTKDDIDRLVRTLEEVIQ